MSAETTEETSTPSRPGGPVPRNLSKGKIVVGWLTSTDHKTIGNL